jgi:hypothetical protein
MGGDEPCVTGQQRHDGDGFWGGGRQVIQAAAVFFLPLCQLAKVVGAESLTQGGELLFFNGGFGLDAEGVAGFSKPPTNGLRLFRVVIIMGKMLGKIPSGVPGRRLVFDGDQIKPTDTARRGLIQAGNPDYNTPTRPLAFDVFCDLLPDFEIQLN